MSKAKNKTTKKDYPIDTEALRIIHNELISYVAGGGTVETRQEIANKLLSIIEGLETH